MWRGGDSDPSVSTLSIKFRFSDFVLRCERFGAIGGTGGVRIDLDSKSSSSFSIDLFTAPSRDTIGGTISLTSAFPTKASHVILLAN